MQFFKYVLLALVGTSGVAIADGKPDANSFSTLSADAIVQPNGGVTSSFLPQDKKENRRTTASIGNKKKLHSNIGNKKKLHSKKYHLDTKKDGGKVQ